MQFDANRNFALPHCKCLHTFKNYYYYVTMTLCNVGCKRANEPLDMRWSRLPNTSGVSTRGAANAFSSLKKVYLKSHMPVIEILFKVLGKSSIFVIMIRLLLFTAGCSSSGSRPQCAPFCPVLRLRIY